MATTVNEETGEITETPQETVETVETADEPEIELSPDGEPGPGDDEGGEEVEEVEDTTAADDALSQKEIEAKIKKLEKASERYTSQVATILGDDLADYFPTPLSEPFLFGFVVRPELRPLPDEVIAATKLLIGEPVPPPFKQSGKADTCPDCDGWGQVLTGSKVQGKQTLTCPTCAGRGAVGEAFNVAPSQMQPGAAPTVSYGGETTEPLLPEDNWGTPLGHPDYGKLPQYRDPGWAEGLEAYRRGEAAPVG